MQEFELTRGSYPTISELLDGFSGAQEAQKLLGQDSSPSHLGPALEKMFGPIEGIIGDIRVAKGNELVCAVSGKVFNLPAALYPEENPQFDLSIRQKQYFVEATNRDNNVSSRAQLKFSSAAEQNILITGPLAKKLGVKDGASISIKLISSAPGEINLDDL